ITHNLREALDEDFPNLQDMNDNMWLWEHEWTAHGSKQPLNVKDYFQATLLTFDSTNADATLKQLPPGGHYPKAKIVEAFNKSGLNPHIVCGKDYKAGKRREQIVEVRFCVDSSAQNLKQVTPCCSRSVIFSQIKTGIMHPIAFP
ncbi:hypothetical protein Tsubulata_009306, partial [Turnera subulata]